MAILISNMSMPDDCKGCKFLIHNPYSRIRSCDINGMLFTTHNRPLDFDGRSKRCPLIGLPEKHGRLIDADELWNKMETYTDNEGAKMPFGDNDELLLRDSVLFMIETAPTLAEAEE